MSEIDWHPPPQQPEGIRWKSVIWSIVGTLALFTAAVVVVWFVFHHREATSNPDLSVPPAIGQPQIHFIRRDTFPNDTAAYRQQRDERARLEGWGWVSREKGRIHIPVEEAIDDLLAAPEGGGRK